MALVIADRVRETTTSTGTGRIILACPYTGFQAFSVIGNGNTTYYALIDAATGAWEVGIGTYTATGNTLSRDTVLSSSNGGAAVNFSAGTKDVIITQPAARAVYLDTASNVTIPGITLSGGTANGVAYRNGSKVLTTGSALTFSGTNLGIGTSSPSAIASGYATVHLASTNGGGVKFGKTSALNIGHAAGSASGVEIGTNGALPFTIFTNNITRATLDSSGNLGLGVTPSAWATYKAIEVGTSGNAMFGGSGSTYAGFVVNAYFNGGWKYANTATGANLFEASGGAYIWYRNNTSGAAGNAISFTQAMTLDASGNLGIGASSPAEKLAVSAASGYVAASVYSGSGNIRMYADGTDTGLQNTQSGGCITFQTNGGSGATERARIDPSGNLLVGTTTVPNVATGGSGFSVSATELIFSSNTNGGNSISYWRTQSGNSFVSSFWNGNSNVGNIAVTNTTTTYNTSSDYRLKENIQ